MAPSEPDKARRCRRLALGVGLLAVLVYLPALHDSFVNWDDPYYVYHNQAIRHLGLPLLRWALVDFHAGNWHPLTWLSHAGDYALWGLNSAGHHLTSILLHGINSLLTVLLACRLLAVAAAGQPDANHAAGPTTNRFTLVAAGVTGVLFAVHPLHVESVVWISERKDLLCALFFLLSLLAYLAAAPVEGEEAFSPVRRRYRRLSLFLFVLALASKPMAVSLPLVLLLLDYYPRRRLSGWPAVLVALREKWPFFLLGGGGVLVTLAAQRESLALNYRVPLGHRLLLACQSLIVYLGKLLLPVNLVPFYPYPQTITLLGWRYLLPVAAVAAITCYFLAWARRRPVWLALWGYYLLTLAPVLGIVQAGFQAMADRYAYLPSMGPFLGVGLGCAWLDRRLGGRPGRRAIVRLLAGLAGVAVILTLAWATVRQTGRWRNSLTLWNYVIDREPGRVPVAYFNRGEAHAEAGDLQAALADYDWAIRLLPGYAEAYRNRGLVLGRKGDYQGAIADYRRALDLRPDDAEVLMARAVACDRLGRFTSAMSDYSRAIALAPKLYQAYNNRALLYVRQGRLELALSDFSQAIALRPDSGSYRANRGRCYLSLGKTGKAAADFRAACDLGDGPACAEARRLGFGG